MTLSANLIARYQSEVDVDWFNAFVFYHPVPGYQFLVDRAEELYGNFNGFLRLFSPAPVNITPPRSSDSGQQSMSITIGNVGLAGIQYMDQAIQQPETPIQCWYSIFIEGDQDPQIDPWVEYVLVNISATRDAIAMSATRADILNRKFPRVIYKVAEWPGLRRR